MNKKIWIIGLFLCICHLGYSQQNISKLFREFKYQENVTKIKLGKGVMAFANLFADTMGVNDIEIITFRNCDDKLKERLSKAIKEVKDPAYDTIISSNENGKRTKVMVRMEKEAIREMVILTSGNEMAMVRIKGEIKPDDIARLINEHGNG